MAMTYNYANQVVSKISGTITTNFSYVHETGWLKGMPMYQWAELQQPSVYLWRQIGQGDEYVSQRNPGV